MMNLETARTFVDALGASSGIIALAGAGGKKSTIYRLLEAHRALGSDRVAVAPTVQTAAPPKKLELTPIMVEGDDLEPALAASRRMDGAFLFTGAEKSLGRFHGLPRQLIAELHARGGFAVSLVKADGARMRRIKAPGDDEPVLPERVATLLPIVSARVIGRPLSEKLAHRPERLTRIIDADLGTTLGPDHIARLLSHPDGALRRAGDAGVVPIINMVDDAERQAVATDAARKALSMTDRFDRVVLAAMGSRTPLIDVIAR